LAGRERQCQGGRCEYSESVTSLHGVAPILGAASRAPMTSVSRLTSKEGNCPPTAWFAAAPSEGLRHVPPTALSREILNVRGRHGNKTRQLLANRLTIALRNNRQFDLRQKSVGNAVVTKIETRRSATSTDRPGSTAHHISQRRARSS